MTTPENPDVEVITIPPPSQEELAEVVKAAEAANPAPTMEEMQAANRDLYLTCEALKAELNTATIRNVQMRKELIDIQSQQHTH